MTGWRVFFAVQWSLACVLLGGNLATGHYVFAAVNSAALVITGVSLALVARYSRMVRP